MFYLVARAPNKAGCTGSYTCANTLGAAASACNSTECVDQNVRPFECVIALRDNEGTCLPDVGHPPGVAHICSCTTQQ